MPGVFFFDMTAKLMNGLAELVVPTYCAGCERPHKLLCANCLAELESYHRSQACPICASPAGALNCTECATTTFSFCHATALGILDGALARAVVLYKDAHERRLGVVFGEALAQRVVAFGQIPNLVTWVPPTNRALRTRGFDHARLLAESMADILGVDAVPCAIRPVARDLRRLDANARRAQTLSSFIALEGCSQSVANKTILLVDDVFTTGSTVEVMSHLLLQAGAASVSVAVVARAW